jgi:hypothetical protein
LHSSYLTIARLPGNGKKKLSAVIPAGFLAPIHGVDMRWRLLTWLALAIGIMVATGLGIDVAVAGMTRASGLAVVIAGFCELCALMLAVAAGRDSAD